LPELRRGARSRSEILASKDGGKLMGEAFCGRCGAPLAPGAAFCGVCRTPVAPVSVASYQQYAYPYPYAQPKAPRIGGARTTQIAVAAGLVVILLIVAIAAAFFAYRSVSGSHPTCTANCSPRLITPLPAAATYHSTAFKFDVDYSETWTIRSQDANGLTLGTKLGLVSVQGMKAGPSSDQVIQTLVSALPSASWQSVTLVSSLRGAHLGDVEGIGQVYSANLIGSNSKAAAVRFVVITATKGSVTVVVFAVDPADLAHYAHGMPEGVLFDYMCTIFRWGS
jgi:hypothetical protein